MQRIVISCAIRQKKLRIDHGFLLGSFWPMFDIYSMHLRRFVFEFLISALCERRRSEAEGRPGLWSSVGHD